MFRKFFNSGVKQPEMKIKSLGSVISSTIISLSVVSCTTANISQLSTENNVSVKKNNNHIVEISKKNGATINVKLNFGNESFGIKAGPIANSQEKDIRSYTVTLCTDPLAPISSDISSDSPITINRDGSSLTSPHTITFVGVPEGGPYYAVVTAYDGINGTGNNITDMAFYSGDATEAQLAVSSNFAIVASNYQLTFSNALTNFLMVNLKLRRAFPGNSDFQIDDAGGFGSPGQFMPAADINLTGNGLIVYEDEREFTVSIYGKYLRHFVPVSSDIIFSDNVISVKAHPSLSINASGDGMLVWEDYRNGNGNIAGRKIVNYLPDGDVFFVASDTTSNKSTPQVRLSTNGDGVVVWSDDRNGSLNIYSRPITAYTPDSVEVQVDTDSATNIYDQLNPKLGDITIPGNTVLVWENKRSNGSSSILMKNIFGFNPSASQPVLVDSDTGDGTTQKLPAISSDLNGNGIIAWVDGRDTDSLHYRPIQGYGLTGSDLLLFNPSGTSMTHAPSIYLNSKGDGVVTFNTVNGGSANQIHGHKIEAYSGTQTTFRIDDGVGTSDRSGPVIQLNERGNGIVVWEDDRNSPADIYARNIIEFEPFNQ